LTMLVKLDKFGSLLIRYDGMLMRVLPTDRNYSVLAERLNAFVTEGESAMLAVGLPDDEWLLSEEGAAFAAASVHRRIGEKWAGKINPITGKARWFTRNQAGKVVPTRAPTTEEQAQMAKTGQTTPEQPQQPQQGPQQAPESQPPDLGGPIPKPKPQVPISPQERAIGMRPPGALERLEQGAARAGAGLPEGTPEQGDVVRVYNNGRWVNGTISHTDDQGQAWINPGTGITFPVPLKNAALVSKRKGPLPPEQQAPPLPQPPQPPPKTRRQKLTEELKVARKKHAELTAKGFKAQAEDMEGHIQAIGNQLGELPPEPKQAAQQPPTQPQAPPPQQSPAPPQQPAQQPPVTPPAPQPKPKTPAKPVKPPKPTVDEMHAEVLKHREQGGDVNALSEKLGKLTNDELTLLAAKLGYAGPRGGKLSGKKAARVEAVKQRALAMAKSGYVPTTAEPAPVQPKPEAKEPEPVEITEADVVPEETAPEAEAERQRLDSLLARAQRQRDQAQAELESSFPTWSRNGPPPGTPPGIRRGYDDRVAMIRGHDEHMATIKGMMAKLPAPKAGPQPMAAPEIKPQTAQSSAGANDVVKAVKFLDAMPGPRKGANLISLIDLRKHLAAGGRTSRAVQDEVIHAARNAGLISLTPFEGGGGQKISDEERAAGIREKTGTGQETLHGYASLKPPKEGAHPLEGNTGPAAPLIETPKLKGPLTPDQKRHADGFRANLARQMHLTDAQKKAYGDGAEYVFSRMPPAALERFRNGTGGVQWHGDANSIKEAFAAATNKPVPKGTIGGMYAYGKKELHLDGPFRQRADVAMKKDRMSVHEAYAHEFGHAIDGPKHEYSNSKEWQEAWAKEIGDNRGNDPKMIPSLGIGKDGKHTLTGYATTSPAEGFAEFSRLLYGHQVSIDRAEKRFPGCVAFFRSKGLLP
jgi:hypothetical protein